MEDPSHDPSADERFIDTGETFISLLAGEVLVRCPRCDQCAQHTPIDVVHRGRNILFAPRRLVCPGCALVKEWRERSLHERWRESPARDNYFGEVLWIRADCGAGQVWAYNWRHLAMIEEYVAAKHRVHRVNAAFVNRLPKWMIAAKNREEVLATIASIKRRG